MADNLFTRLKHAWNVFSQKDYYSSPKGASYTYRPDRTRFRYSTEKTIANAVFNRIAIDVAAVNINHVKLDEDGRFLEIIDDPLNSIFSEEANIDQTSRAFMQDAVMSMFDEGCVALVPVDADVQIDHKTGERKKDILSIRTGKIEAWAPLRVKVNLYNDQTGQRESVWVDKKDTAIIENPFYSVMNEDNSVLKRLIRKLNLLDAVDEQNSSGKLDLIIQLPYVIKTQARRDQAEIRRRDIEQQLKGSKYGIAYTDGTERITQLNRPVENTLMNQISYLTDMFYSQLGITQEIMNGTANENEVANYDTRIIEVILSAIVDECRRKFLSREARDRKESLMFFRDVFRLVPVSKIADIADKFTRNEIMSSNEFRQVLGRKPSEDPKADMLLNKNISQSKELTDEINKKMNK